MSANAEPAAGPDAAITPPVVSQRKHPVATISQTLRTIVITAGIVILAVGWPLAALARVQAIRRSTLGYQLRLDDPVLIVTGLILLGLIISFIMSFRPLRRHDGIRELQTGFRTVMADSYFGQGHYKGWTHTNPQSDLSLLEYADPNDYDDLIATPYEQAQPERVVRMHPTAVEEPEPIAEPAPAIEYTVQRRDSWRRIAEAQVGDANRAGEIRELNIGRTVAPGEVLRADTALRSGWIILVPAQ